LFYKAAKEVQQADIQQMAWWVHGLQELHVICLPQLAA
jgi:hypothetical protein